MVSLWWTLGSSSPLWGPTESLIAHLVKQTILPHKLDENLPYLLVQVIQYTASGHL